MLKKEKLSKSIGHDRHLDCSMCAYKSCKQMAEAVAFVINHHYNGAPLVKKSPTKNGKRLRLIIDNIPQAVNLFDKKQNIVDCNDAAVKLFGARDKNDYLNRFQEISVPIQPDGMKQQAKSAVIMAKAYDAERLSFEWMNQSLETGEQIPCEVTLVPVEWHGDSFAMAFVKDLREQKNMLAKLEAVIGSEQAANNAKSKLLSNVSHEINTPLNSIIGLAEIQLQSSEHPPEVEEAFSRIYNASVLLRSLTNDILNLSKMEAGKMKIMPGTYKTASMIMNTVQLNLIHIGGKNIAFNLHVDENMPARLIGDELRVKQIVSNLLSNAFKYTAEGTVDLSFGAERAADPDSVTLVVHISDTGQGMTKEQIGNLFSEFTRFNLEANHTIEGNGLGMFIVHQLMCLMGGSITVDSEPGRGSSFVICLPQKKNDAEVLGTETAACLQSLKDIQRHLKKPSKFEIEPMPYGRVLVVDDVGANLYVAKRCMKPYGLMVDTADSGELAVSKIKGGEIYDIIFMDNMMPGMDGIETTKIMRTMGYDRPIVALTADTMGDTKKMFISNGFSDFLAKPIDLGQLNECLIRFIRDKNTLEVNKSGRQ